MRPVQRAGSVPAVMTTLDEIAEVSPALLAFSV